jgi:hypothetical protein
MPRSSSTSGGALAKRAAPAHLRNADAVPAHDQEGDGVLQHSLQRRLDTRHRIRLRQARLPARGRDPAGAPSHGFSKSSPE